MRGNSEPPEERLVSLQGEYSWEWGAMPKLSADTSPSASTIRGNSSPNIDTIPLAGSRTPPTHVGLGRPLAAGPFPSTRPVSDSDSLFGDGGRLVDGDVESGEPIAMEYDGVRRLAFDLSLCGPAATSMDPPEAARLFDGSKVTLQRLLEDAAVVHSDKLVIRWDEKCIARTDGTPLFDALVAWRDNTLAQRASTVLNPRSTAPRGRSSWLWWGRSRSDRAKTMTSEDPSEARQRPGLPDAPSAPAGLDLVRVTLPRGERGR
jgi:hypothetical protein